MKRFSKRQLLIALAASVLTGVGIFWLVSVQEEPMSAPAQIEGSQGQVPQREVIGTSVQGRPIEAYTFGQGDMHLLFVGGMHGGYEWNTVLLAEMFIEYFQEHPDIILANLRVSVIPNANPDGVQKGIGTAEARFNANGVDLNRNFDCNWKSEGMWRANVVSAGQAPFSEPEAAAIRNFVLERNPRAVIFWHSQANAVYPGECGGDISAETRDIMNAYAGAAGYQAFDSFDQYEITGSADGWLALRGIPALTVELQSHETVEWERNLAGMLALFEYYGRK